MGSIPDFVTSAYGPTELEKFSISMLAGSFDLITRKVDEANAEARRVRGLRVGPGQLPASLAAITIANKTLADLRNIHRDVRIELARRLKTTCSDRGYLVGTVVYRAQHDAMGVERIVLFNPPAGRA